MNCFEFSKYIAEQILEESDAVVKYEQFLGMVKSEIHFMEQRLKEDAILKSEKEDKEPDEEDDDNEIEIPEMYRLSEEEIGEIKEKIVKYKKVINSTKEIVADEKQHIIKFMGLVEMFDEIKPKVD